MTSDERPAAPGAPLERERFLAAFALACAEEFELPRITEWFVAETGRLLGVDRVTLFLVDGPAELAHVTRRASWLRAGTPPLAPEFDRLESFQFPAPIREGKPLVLFDIATDESIGAERERLVKAGARSMLAVPVLVDGAIRGVVAASTTLSRRAFGEADVEFLTWGVRHLASAMRQEELIEQVGRERDRLRALFDLVTGVHRSRSLAEVIDVALAGLKSTLGFPVGIVGLLSPDGGSMVGVRGYHPASPENGPLPDIALAPAEGAKPLVALALESGRPLLVDNVETDPRAAGSRERLRALGVRSVGVFPLHGSGGELGILAIGCGGESRRIDPEDVVTVQSLAGFVGIAMEQRRAADAVARAAREARLLSEATRALLTRTASRDVLLGQILDALVGPFGQDNCSVLVVDREKGLIFEVARRGEGVPPVGPAGLRVDGPGLIALSVREGRVVNSPDVTTNGLYLLGWTDCRSELVVPLKIDGVVVGVFDIQSSRPAAFDEDDVRLLTSFADRAALALRLSDLVGTLEERTRVLEAVGRATRLLNFRLHAPDVLSSVVEETSRAFLNADGAVAYVADDTGSSLTVAAAFGLGRATERTFGASRIPVDDLRCAGAAFREDRPVLLATAGLDELMNGYPAETRARTRSAVDGGDIRHLMAAPIRVGDQRLGVIEVLSSQEKAFTPRDAETLVFLAEQAAIALRNARMIEELRRSNRLKDDFLANLSHEVRTPLTGIVGWAEVLLDSKGDDPETRKALRSILDQAETLSRMLGDLIDLSRIDNFGLEIRRTKVALAEILAEAFDAVAPTAKKRGVTVAIDVPPDLPRLEADAARLKQVAWNLLTNAVKFSPQGETVAVVGRRSEQGGIELEVSDHGVGIDPAFLPYVFDRFRQEQSAPNRRFGGLGVGLTIARAIVEAHGGTIHVASEGHGRGSRFVVWFPSSRFAKPSGAFEKVDRA